MANDLEPLVLKITGSANGLSAAIGRAESDLKRFTAQAKAQQSEIAAMPSLSSLLIGGGVGAGTLGAFKLASQAEQAAVAFEVLTGSVAESAKMIEQLRALGASTPLNFVGLQENAKVMLGFGIAVGDVLPNLRVLGDISGGNSEKMRALTLAFSQSAAAGRLMGQDVLQMINAGFNPLQEISKNTGKTMVQLKADMEAGAISFDMVRAAFISATAEGGRFNGMLEKQAETLAGTTGILVDKTQQLAASMAAVLAPAVKDTVVQLTAMLDRMSALNAAEVQSAVAIGASVAAFIAVVTIAPRVIAAFTAITKGLATMQAFSGPKGWATLALSIAAAAGAAYAVDAAFSRYQSSLAAADRKSIDAIGAQNALANSAQAVAGAVSQAALAMDKLAAQGLASNAAAQLATNTQRLKEDLKMAEFAAAALNAEMERTGKIEALNQAEAARTKAVEAISKIQMKGTRLDSDGNAGAKKQYEEQMALVALAQQKMSQLQKELGGNLAKGRGAEQIKKELEASSKAIADLKAELGSLDGSLVKNKEYWEEQAKAARKSFELPIDAFKNSLLSLAEAVKQGGLEWAVFERGAAAALETYRKATELKRELEKPVQFSSAVMRGSATDIQDRFRYTTTSINAQQIQKQDEANRLLEQIRDELKKNKGNPPVAKIT